MAEEAKASPEPVVKDLWADIYYKDTQPLLMREGERNEVDFGYSCFCTLLS